MTVGPKTARRETLVGSRSSSQTMPWKATGPSCQQRRPFVTLSRALACLRRVVVVTSLVTTLATALVTAATAQTRGPLKPGSRRAPRPRVSSTTVVILQGTLEQVDDVAVVLTTREDRTVRVLYRETTKFFLDDRPVTAAFLKVGDSITVRARRTDQGVLLSESVMVQLTPSGAPASAGARTAPAAPASAPRGDEDAGPPTLRRRRTAEASRSPQRQPPPLADDDDPGPPVLRRGGSRERRSPAAMRPPDLPQDPPDPPGEEDEGPPVLRRNDPPKPPSDDEKLSAEEQLPITDELPTQPAENLGSAVSSAQLDPLIEQARYRAFEYSEKLPNFVCREVMNRMQRQGRRGGWQTLDVLETDLVYEDGKEDYRNIKINNRAVKKGMEQIDGSWSIGEFATTLLHIFSPVSQTTFRFNRSSRAAGEPAVVYDFRIEEPNSRWQVTGSAETITPAYKGAIWIHEKTAQVLRIETEAFDIAADFDLDTVEMTVDYGFVRISGEQYLLPIASENLACWRGSSNCSRNKIEFRNYRKFGAESSIVTTDSEITFDGEDPPPATKP